MVAGTALLASATPIADRADLASPAVVRAIGVFLLFLGADLALLTRVPERWARVGTAVTGLGDVGWVVGSLVIVATAALPGWAAAAGLAQAALTLGIAMAKRAALRSAVR